MRDPETDPNRHLPAIAVVTPVYGHSAPSARISQERLVAVNVAKRLFVHVDHKLGTYIDAASCELVQRCLDHPNRPTHILFTDQDMVIPPDAPERLAAHRLPVVGALYFLKAEPCTPVAYNFHPSFYMLPKVPKKPLAQVGGVGFGCTLVDVEVFQKMEAHYGDKHWFKTTMEVGQDVWFSLRCREMGIPIHLDSTVRCRHVGDIEVGIEQYRFAMHRRRLRGEVTPEDQLHAKNRGRR